MAEAIQDIDEMPVPIDELTDRPEEEIEYFVVHHSVAGQSVDIEDLAKMEEESQGFVTIGYNCYAKKTASGWVIQEGRPMNKLPAAQYGLNAQGYAMCIGGNYQPNVTGIATNEVEQASLDLVVERVKAVQGKAKNLKYLIGHRDVADIMADRGLNPEDYSTLCPGDLLYAKLDWIREQTGLK